MTEQELAIDRRIQQTFRDFLVPISSSSIEVDSFYEFHVVQERVERHKVGEADTFSALPPWRCCHQVCFHFPRQQMALDIYHDILEVERGNKSRTRLVRPPECFHRVLLVKVLQNVQLHCMKV